MNHLLMTIENKPCVLRSRPFLQLIVALLAAAFGFVSGGVAQSLFMSGEAVSNPTAVAGVQRFNPSTGALESIFAGVGPVNGIAFGPSGDLFGASFQGQQVVRLDGTTGQLKATSGSEVSRPIGVACRSDGDIFVSDNTGSRVVRYDGRTFAYKGVFASGGGVVGIWHITFGPDGDLYVASSGNGRVMRFDGNTGAFKGIFVSTAQVTEIYGLTFGPDGDLYVSAAHTDPIFRFNGTTGAFKGAFTSGRQLIDADQLTFGPDGDLYVASYGTAEVDRFDGTTGVFKSVAASGSTVGNPSGVEFTPQAKVLNVSTRLPVQTGDNVLIGGFIITGRDAKKIIVRGIGPSLGGVGIAGALADPRLELRNSSGALVASNDNWRVTQPGGAIPGDQQAEIQASGLAPTNDQESAIIATLEPGSYTAVLQGVNGSTGIGVVEAYDLNQATPSKLANISTRGFVNTGDNVMIGGFIVRPGGGTETRIVVRAIGPSLQPGIPNALADPFLELHDSSGATIASNNNWRDSQETDIQNTGLAPTNDAESAILANLPPGAYTAIVRGNNNTTGVAVVELYNLN
jgi:streptogramin lyase